MSRFFYNQGSTFDLTEEIIGVIEDATEYIKTGNFLFQDPTVNDALLDAMERGVAVFILSNISDPDRKRKNDEGGHVDTHAFNLKTLRRNGAHCRGLDDLHAKFIIRDGVDGLLMSANYSPNSVDRNIETGVRLDESEIRDLERTFDLLYVNADVQSLSGGIPRGQILRTSSRLEADAFDAFGKDNGLRLTIASQKKKYGGETNLAACRVYTIYESILSVIRHAQKSLDIVTWHFNALDRLPEFTSAVEEAIGRGVRVRLYSNCRQNNDSLKESLNAISFLEKLGCTSFGDDCNHSKCVISESEGVIFTANIDGNHGLRNGFEVGCTLIGDTLDEMRSFVNTLFD